MGKGVCITDSCPQTKHKVLKYVIHFKLKLTSFSGIIFSLITNPIPNNFIILLRNYTRYVMIIFLWYIDLLVKSDASVHRRKETRKGRWEKKKT